jgi:hypothetical protein
MSSMLNELRDLSSLYKEGIVDQSEYEDMKRSLIARYKQATAPCNSLPVELDKGKPATCSNFSCFVDSYLLVPNGKKEAARHLRIPSNSA